MMSTRAEEAKAGKWIISHRIGALTMRASFEPATMRLGPGGVFDRLDGKMLLY
jgi:hypothetical protein